MPFVGRGEVARVLRYKTLPLLTPPSGPTGVPYAYAQGPMVVLGGGRFLMSEVPL